MSKLKVATISYLNSIPFVYGLENSSLDLDIKLDIPSNCAKKLLEGEVDLALVPVAILPMLREYYIIGESCIGANGKVETVCLYSDVPLNQIDTILLDYHSKTSVQLLKVLCNKYWKINPKFIETSSGFEQKINGKVAGLIIGDRAYNYHNQYKNMFDLSEHWKQFTGLPFVFACWVSKTKFSDEIVSQFDKAIKYGLNNLDAALEKKSKQFNTTIDKKKYLTEIISYQLSQKKKEALNLFLSFIK
ncbi:MAG: menaquinone biosynthetic enzyme MqnA/MqnD family protein [Flavobacteriales bacterium]